MPRFLVRRCRRERTVDAEAGVVDEDVDRQLPRSELAGDGLNRIRGGQILGDDVRIHAMRSRQLAGERGETVRAARHEDHVRARRREQPGKLFADSAGGAGDKGCVGHGVMLSLCRGSGLGARDSDSGLDSGFRLQPEGCGCRFEDSAQSRSRRPRRMRGLADDCPDREGHERHVGGTCERDERIAIDERTHDNSSAGGP